MTKPAKPSLRFNMADAMAERHGRAPVQANTLGQPVARPKAYSILDAMRKIAAEDRG